MHEMPHASMDAMAGLPPAVLGGAILLACLLTGWALARGSRWFPHGPAGWRFDLLSLRPIHALVSKRPFQFAVQLPLVLALFLILAAGFLGSQVADRNLATMLTWTIWWTLLIVDIVLLGRMWCLVCPWDALASWIRRLAFWRCREEPLALQLRWPRWLRNVYPATILFIGLTWLELGFGVTRSPRATAILGLLMVLLAVIPALVFERKSFCTYGCLIGRICGLYSMVAPVEVRARDTGMCRSCDTKDCLHGNARGYPCPTGQSLAGMTTNTYYTVCTECVKSCPHDNVALNLRPWATDLQTVGRPRRDETVLALVMVSLTSFHGLTMTPAWTEMLAWLRAATGLGYLPAFSVGMLVVLVMPGLVYVAASALTRRAISRDGRAASLWHVAGRYAYSLIAVALVYHLAHNAGHLIVEGSRIVPVLSDPFGRGQDLISTAGFVPGPMARASTIWALQILLILLGLHWALRATERAHRRLAATLHRPALPLAARLVPSAFMLALTLCNLWLLAQPMEMRTGL